MMRARLALFLLLAASASAQTTGSISGRILDAQSNRPVAGAVVAASSPALQAEESARTDSSGEFLIALLPPGTYTLFVQGEGHQAFTQEGVQVDVGREVRLRLSILPDSMLFAPVRVGAPPPVVPVTTARGGMVIQREQMELIPYGRDVRSYESAAVSVPGVLPEGLEIFGSPAEATRYRVDGLVVNDPATQLQGRRLLQHFVDQVAVETHALGAEYGRAGAGVVEAVTRSGSNDLHGSAFLDWMPIEIPRKTLRYDLAGGADLGGALERNRVWFYGGFAPVLQATTAGAETEYQYVGKFTWRPADGQTLVLSAISDDFSLRYLGNVADRAQVEAVAGWSHQSQSDSVQARVNVVQRADFFGRHRFAYGFDSAHESAAGEGRWAIAGFLQDTWSPIDGWSFEGGLQVDHEEAPSANEVLPRLGVSWDFSGEGTSRAYAFFGRFLDPAPLGVAVRTIERQFALGVEQQVFRDLVGGLGYVRKQFDGAPDGRTGYDAVTVSVAKPFSASSLLRASYTLSSLRGAAGIAEDASNAFKIDAAYAYEWSAKTTVTLGTSFRAIEASPWQTTIDMRLALLRALSGPYLLSLSLDVLNLLNRQAGGTPPLAIRFGGRLSF
ncbi:MAG: carboxypeptidase regulatory-like domain-containing protein [Myxococcales bacterium]